MATIEVFPEKSGRWRWRRGSDKSKAFDTRSEAIEAAAELAGVQWLFDKDGSPVQKSEPIASVVLLRLDGSVHGELFAPRSTGRAQHVNLTPAGENAEAGLNG